MDILVYLTGKNGRLAVLSGDEVTIHGIEMALTVAGWKYHEPTASWDEGFYKEGHAE